jgi:hypothetical protein
MLARPLGLVGSALAFVVATSAWVPAQAPPPWVGVWRLNISKTTMSPGPKPASSTVTIQPADGGGFRQVTEQSLGLGASKSEFTAKFDGADYPIRGNPNADVIALKRIDELTYEMIGKKGGKVMITSRVVHSADGRTRTVTQSGVDAKGQKVMNTLVYDRGR